jgi:hypothetical protein
LATVVDGRPDIHPVNHLVDHGTVLFRTAEGMKLRAAVGHDVTFEADGYDAGAAGLERRRQGRRARDFRAGRVPRRDDPPAVSVAGRPEAAVCPDRAGSGHWREVVVSGGYMANETGC